MSISTQQATSIGRFRRRSRALVRQHQVHDPAVANLLRAYHPDFAGLSPDEIFRKPLTLNEAQMVLMREQGLSVKVPATTQQKASVGSPRVIPELIEKPEYRRELAAKRGLPSIGTHQVSEHGMEYTVIEHGFVLSQAGVSRANGGEIVPNIEEFMPMISLTNMSPRLLGLYSEVDRCTSKELFFFDTMPDKFPRQAAPGLHHVQTTQDPSCLTFHLDACRLHETILAHELSHLWIEFVEGCEDWRNLKDHLDMAKVVQFQHLQSFVLDLKVNAFIQSRGFDVSVIDRHQQETIRELARHCAKGDPIRTLRAAAGMANAIAGAILEHKRWQKNVLQEFQTNLAAIKAGMPEVYRLAEQFVASVEQHGYADREAICRVIDECAVLSFKATGDEFDPVVLSFKATGDEFDPVSDLAEARPTECMRDKYPDFLPGLPVATKLAIGKVAAKHGFGEQVKWELVVIRPDHVDIRIQSGSIENTEQVVVSLINSSNWPSISHTQQQMASPMQQMQNRRYTPPPTKIPIAMPAMPMVPALAWRSESNINEQAWIPPSRNYMAGVGLFLSRTGFEEQQMGEHPYGYAENNPVIYIDPDGLIPLQMDNIRHANLASRNGTLNCPKTMPPDKGSADYAIACSKQLATSISASFTLPKCCNVPSAFINFYLSMGGFEAGVSFSPGNNGWAAFFNKPGGEEHLPGVNLQPGQTVNMSLFRLKSGRVRFVIDGHSKDSSTKYTVLDQARAVTGAIRPNTHSQATWSNIQVKGGMQGTPWQWGGEMIISNLLSSKNGDPTKPCDSSQYGPNPTNCCKP